MINTIIVDNEPACIKTLSKDLMRYPEIRVVETITSSEEARLLIPKIKPDLLFLDIEMPGMNGLELLDAIHDQIRSQMCVVFYSAFNKYMIDALRSSVFDFLLKLYEPEELDLIIERIKDKLKSNRLNITMPSSQLLVHSGRFALNTVKGLIFLKPSDVLCFLYFKDQRFWQITLTDMTTCNLRQHTSSKDILKINPSFFQINQGVILNLDYLMSIENKTGRCMLYPSFKDIELFISRRYYTKIREILEIL